jgi:hypothetical protein
MSASAIPLRSESQYPRPGGFRLAVRDGQVRVGAHRAGTGSPRSVLKLRTTSIMRLNACQGALRDEAAKMLARWLSDAPAQGVTSYLTAVLLDRLAQLVVALKAVLSQDPLWYIPKGAQQPVGDFRIQVLRREASTRGF